jgi:membrane protease subunit (stomatin/prohibitin family)
MSSVTNDSIGVNSSVTTSVTKSIETGRIEKGDSSDQLFETVNGNFSTFATSAITIKLLPESQKPVEVSTLRNYCTNCGTRSKKQSWKFCPNCGEKI